VQALRGNASLTALDVRGIKGIDALYDTVAKQLLETSSTMRLGYMRCDAFDIMESDKDIDMHEERLEPSAVRLLAGLLKCNTKLEELDLSAADVDDEGGNALAEVFSHNLALAKLKLLYNPMLTDKCKANLRKAAADYKPTLRLEL